MSISSENAVPTKGGDAAPAPQFGRDQFLWFSSQLIHVKQEFLKPVMSQDGIQLCDLYFNILQENAEKISFGEFLEDLDDWRFQEKLPENLLAESGTPSDGVHAWAARMTMMMWLFGMWMGETENARLKGKTRQYFATTSGRPLQDYVISSRAYENGWIWRIAQAHPMGISQFGFGSWAERPPGLSDYGFEKIT